MTHKFLSSTELAKILGISRVAVFKKIKTGRIKAQKVGRNFVVSRDDLPGILGKELPESRREEISRAVRKVARDYGEALKMLGRE